MLKNSTIFSSELLNEYRQKGIIDNAEWRRLVEKALALYARSIKD